MLSDLINYGPPYFSKFKDLLDAPEVIEAIPVKKTPILAACAMDLSNSTIVGNIDSVINLML